MSKSTRSAAKNRRKKHLLHRQIVGKHISLDDFAVLSTVEQEAWAGEMVKTNDPEILEPMLPQVLAGFLREFGSKALDHNVLRELADPSAGKKCQDVRM